MDTRCNGPVTGRTRTWNRTGNLDPLLTLIGTGLGKRMVAEDGVGGGSGAGVKGNWERFHNICVGFQK